MPELIHRIWQAYRDADATSHGAFLAPGYLAVHPDGTLHRGAPTRDELLASPIGAFALTEVTVTQLAPAVALVSYLARVEVPGPGSPAPVRLRVGEVWRAREGRWECASYQATVLPADPPARRRPR